MWTSVGTGLGTRVVQPSFEHYSFVPFRCVHHKGWRGYRNYCGVGCVQHSLCHRHVWTAGQTGNNAQSRKTLISSPFCTIHLFVWWGLWQTGSAIYVVFTRSDCHLSYITLIQLGNCLLLFFLLIVLPSVCQFLSLFCFVSLICNVIVPYRCCPPSVSPSVSLSVCPLKIWILW